MRRQYLVDRKFQFRYAALMLIFCIVVAFVTGWTVFYTGWSMLGEKLAAVYPQGRLLAVLRDVNIALFRNLVLLIPVIFVFSIYFSHRIAGPLVRIRMGIRDIGNGNFDKKIKLRKNDELKEIAGEINKMQEKLKALFDKEGDKV